MQQWFSDLDSRDVCYNYRLYKSQLCFENYFNVLPEHLAVIFVHFRTLSHRLPIQRGRILGIPHNERVCPKCNLGDIRDEFHYVFKCPFFDEPRKKYLKKYFLNRPNILKFQSLFSSRKKSQLRNLINFLKIIMISF